MKTPVPPPSVNPFEALLRKHTTTRHHTAVCAPWALAPPVCRADIDDRTSLSQGYDTFHFSLNVLFFKLSRPSRLCGSFACCAGLPLLRRSGTSLCASASPTVYGGN
jgi:hypothetical protein